MALYPRSSITKRGVMLGNSVGLIDNGYTGEIIAIFNKININACIKEGDRVVQLVPLKMPFVDFIEVDELSETNRGDKGFGSSGA
jgi:dUTP pyrophosphatase